ncbi:MAG TPA: protein kinase [Myxococcota bacterium]|nr:protein kinase [Myxococcota bacterium]HRY94697.1 protein kinase [Myxococcota bacterium]HSA20265.1 protein kinase [Myxococcota bacterium]
MPLRIVCDKCNTEHKLPDDRPVLRPSKLTCRGCQQIIILVPGPNGLQVTGGNVRSSLEPQMPKQLGRFAIKERLASGGMGDIYLATMGGAEGFEREVVLKVLHPHLARDEAFAKALVDEAKITVLLHHPNIVQVYNLERSGELLYCVMEFVPGMALSAIQKTYRKKGATIPVPMTLYIAIEALDGLAYAHDLRDRKGELLGIVHRDISPHNIMVTQDGWVKIIDFGIAKAASRITQTQPGTVKGKFAYMAPEQFTGKPDHRADVFAMGVVLWESLSGVRLFHSQTDVDTLQKVLYLDPPPIGKTRLEVDAKLDAILLKALDKDPDKRYQHAREFRDALLAFVAPATRAQLREQVDIEAKHLSHLPDQEVSEGGPDATPALPSGEMHDAATRADARTPAVPGVPPEKAPPGRPGGHTGLWLGLGALVLLGLTGAGLWFGGLLRFGGPDVADAGDGRGALVPPPAADGADAAPTPDAGPAVDAGPAPDAGSAPDAGGGPDAGPPPDGGGAIALQPDKDKPPPPRVRLDRGHVAKVLRRQGQGLQACADKHLAQTGTTVDLVLEFTIDGEGRVTEATLQPAALATQDFGRCLLQRVKSLRFPRHLDKSVTIAFPLQFQAVPR